MDFQWTHLSTANGDLPLPTESTQQTAALVLDIDRDGVNDFVIGSREGAPSMVWYRRDSQGWTRYLIDDAVLPIEAGGASHDIDGDGDLDIVMGADYSGNQVWWWENPYPDFNPDTPWTRRLIKNEGANKHHDQMFADADGDGRVELVFWNQNASALMLAEIPDDPRNTEPWTYTPIYAGEGEGLALADIDGDGQPDLLAAGRWFKHNGGTDFTPYVIDDSQAEARIAAGDLVEGGHPEVVMVPGDFVGPLRWYECRGDPTDPACWEPHELLDFEVDHGHSLQIIDMNGDGHLDIFVAEMRVDGNNADAGMWIFLGDGQGNFQRRDVAQGYGNHESRAADLDGDGDMDILGKPHNWDTPRLDIWINTPLPERGPLPLTEWERHVIDAEKPWRSVFITPADINGDGQVDIITGGWWYENPGTPGGAWTRHVIGAPLDNMAAVYDFDGDGDMDILGTTGRVASEHFVWAQNDGAGRFTIRQNLDEASGDFLQGIAVARFRGQELEVLMSWHQAGQEIQRFRVPADPTSGTWAWDRISPISQDEEITAGDIDRDGDLDLLLGTRWLRNDPETWRPYILGPVDLSPDRNRLADINQDGLLDAIVGFEAVSAPGRLAWYEQGTPATEAWSEHVIANPIGPMSLDVADMDEDGDIDVVVGEHNLNDPASARLLIFENADGVGGSWTEHVVYTGDEHHDGAQVVDIDGDGDLDIISIGWENPRVLLYENRAIESGPPVGETPQPQDTQAPPTATAAPPTDTPAVARVTDGLQALYTFNEGQGTVVRDVSGVSGLDLTISDPENVSWIPGGLSIVSATIVGSAEPATALIEAVRRSNAITVEAWIKSSEINQTGPARIVTISADQLNRNVTLGQGMANDQPNLYNVRLRTTATDENGQPALSTPPGAVSLALTHVVYTRDSDGAARIYVDGELAVGGSVAGDLSNWSSDYRLALGNELTEDRPWLGEYFLVAVYNRALSQEEVRQNFQTGPEAQ